MLIIRPHKTQVFTELNVYRHGHRETYPGGNQAHSVTCIERGRERALADSRENKIEIKLMK